MTPEEITEDNWVQALEGFLLPVVDPLSASMREHLSIEGQSAMRTMREMLPCYVVTVPTVEEV